jgi:hypothetical protein
MVTVLSYVAIFVLGAVASWYLLPHFVPVGIAVDRATGKQYMIDLKTGKALAEVPPGALDSIAPLLPPDSRNPSIAPTGDNIIQPGTRSDAQPAMQAPAKPAEKKRGDVH